MSKAKQDYGSQHDLQVLANKNQGLYAEAFAKAVGRRVSEIEIEWKSPLEKEYKEYCTFPGFITVSAKLKAFKTMLKEAWPKRKPQWDGIAIDTTADEYLLIEAKAHISEISSCIRATEESQRIIREKLEAFATTLNVPFNEDIWLQKYYQTANRLYFLHLLNNFDNITGKKVRLVYIIFLNDPIVAERNKKETEHDWNKTLDAVEQELLGLSKHPRLSPFITRVFIDFNDLKK